MGNKEKLILFLTWIARLITGATFIFSGFVKSIDPWGTLYKMEDYLSAMHLSLWPNLLLTCVFVLCTLEFVMGVFLILGCFRRSITILTAAFMAFMLILTLWIAIYDPVADCGCFGDAFIISNWATFWKNVVLSLFVVWLLKYNRRCRCIIEPFAQWLAFVATAIYILAIALIGYTYQPLLDFRQYPVGSDLIEPSLPDESTLSGDENFVFIYEKDGELKEFTVDDELPDEAEGWQFVERKETVSSKTDNGTEIKVEERYSVRTSKNLRIWDENGNEDVTEMAAPSEGKRLFLMMPDLAGVSIATSWQINSLYSWAEKNGIEMIAIVNGTPHEIERWKDIALASYQIFTSDDTQIKEVVRGNPSVVYTDNGKIIWKSTLKALNTDDFLSPEISKDPKDFKRNDKNILINLTLIYIAVLAFLILISYSPALAGLFFKRSNRKTLDNTSTEPEAKEEKKEK